MEYELDGDLYIYLSSTPLSVQFVKTMLRSGAALTQLPGWVSEEDLARDEQPIAWAS